MEKSVLLLATVLFFTSLSAKPCSRRNEALLSRRYPVECQPILQTTDIKIFLTVSSLASFQNGDISERKLEINWFNGQPRDGDRVALYHYVPGECSLEDSLEEYQPILSTDDWYRTNVSLHRYEELDMVGKDGCLDYFAAYFRNGEVLATDCIKTNYDWMTTSREFIGEKRIREIMIPGTHDSGAYSYIDDSVLNNVIARYATTQEENLFNQLYLGIRYLDMRILEVDNATEQFWIHHGPVIYRPARNDIDRVKQFLDISRDIVIFDIHGVDASSHQELQSFLVENFEGYMLPRNLTWDATLNDLWSYMDNSGWVSRGGVIVTYNDINLGDHPLLWEAVRHKWGNVQSTEDLKTYLSGVMAEAEEGMFDFPWSAMAELTPTTSDTIYDTLEGLRGAADMVNRNVTRWLRSDWLQSATIVATDFFLGSNVVDICILGNKIVQS